MIKIEIKGPIVSNAIGWVYHYLGWDACCPKDVSDKLQEAAGDDVVLEINSPGGYCDYGFEIYTMLMEYSGKVTANVITAASAASVIACAADIAKISDVGVYMIHNCSGGGTGDYRDMQSVTESLKQYNESIINAYVRKTGKSREELQEMMDFETTMSPQKAIEHGFIDEYMFGDPNESRAEEEAEEASATPIVMNSCVPVLTEEKAMEMANMILQSNPQEKLPAGLLLEPVGHKAQPQISGSDAASEIEATVNQTEEGEKQVMNLEEMFQEHPELKAEVDVLVSNAREEGIQSERERLQELDEIAPRVTAELLQGAKYGENPMDAKDLAFLALKKDGMRAANYMNDALEDSVDSGAEDVGASPVDDGQEKDASTQAATYVNQMRGGKK